MTRERLTDFKDLQVYLDEYRLQSLDNATYVASLKRMHKVYFSILTWNAEMGSSREKFCWGGTIVNDAVYARISESISDLGASFFNFAHGSYKASRMMLRSSIENFIRAMSAMEDPTQQLEKNVFTLFEKSAILQIFQSSPLAMRIFRQLHSDYKLLCLDTHTATAMNMEHITSLADFPRFDEAKSAAGVNIFVRVAQNILSFLCLVFNIFFHAMHYKNKQNILISVPSQIRPILHGM